MCPCAGRVSGVSIFSGYAVSNGTCGSGRITFVRGESVWLRLCICRSAGKDVKDMHKIFGQREKGQYYDRSGAYLVIFPGEKQQ